MWDIEGVASTEAAEDQLSRREGQKKRREEKRREEKRRDDGTRSRTVKYHPRETRAGPILSKTATITPASASDLALDEDSARARQPVAAQFCFERPTHPPSHTHTRRHRDGNVQSSGGSSNDTQREQRGIARISCHQQQRQPTQAMTIAATTTTATAAPTRARWWSQQGSTGGERTASSSRDDSSGSTTYQYS